MYSDAQTVEEYITSLPESRQRDVQTLRNLAQRHLPKGYEEGMLFGMICYYIPLAVYPNTYNKQPLCYIAIASQKNYMSLYLMGIYSQSKNEAWLKDAFAKAGKKLDMGKSCIRFKTLDELPLDVVTEAVALQTPADYIKAYEKSRQK